MRHVVWCSMIVLALLAIIAGVAAPNLRAYMTTLRAKSLSYDLVTDLLVARSAPATPA